MSAHFTPTDEMLLLAETLGEVKTKTEKLEAEFSTQARPLEAATNALSAALAGIKALQFHVLDNNLGALSARVEEMRRAVDEQVGVIAMELKKADETNAAKAGQDAEALRAEIAGLQAQLGTLGAQFTAQLARVEFAAKEEAKALQLIPGPAGATGASLNPRGTFVDGETYNRLDVVSWLGSSYIAAVDGVNEKPSKNSNQWQVLASRGGGAAGGAGDFGSLAGVAQINQGGTGQTTRAAGLNALLPDQAGNTQYILLTDGAGTVSWGAQPVAGLPSQTSNGGKLLTTDGTNASWSSTLTGSLVVNGTLTSGSTLSTSAGLSCQNADITGGYITLRGFGTQDGGLIFLGQAANNNYINSSASAISTAIANTAVVRAQAEGWRVLTTTASTTTSTGALVVGNGTSGGLGVGGAANIGGTLTVNGASTLTGATTIGGDSSNGNYLSYNADISGFCGLWMRQSSKSATNYVLASNGTSGTLVNATGASLFLRIENTTALEINTSRNVLIPATTASTSTSSGALVVSGGVGVAKGMVVGDQLRVTNASIPDLWLQNTSGATSAYRNILLRQNSDDTFKFLSTSDAGVLSKDNILTGSNASGAIGIGVAPGAGTSSLTVAGNLIVSGTQNTFGVPSSASALGTNSTMTFELTSNTSLAIKVRGSDGTTRSVSLTLA